jgi:polar amino acid transport system substrate-binding protein
MRLRLGLALAAIGLVIATAAQADETLDRIKARGKIIFAAMPDALPTAGYDKSGTLTGFDIEVAILIAERMGVEYSFVTPTWQEVLAGGWARRWDACVCSMTPTVAREKTLAFPVVYRYSPATLLVNADNTTITTPADASGKVIGVKADTTYEKYLEGKLSIYKGEKNFEYVIKNPEILVFPDKADAVKALAEGDGTKLDAVVTSFEHSVQVLDAELPVRAVPGFLFFEPVAVTTEKDADALGDAIEAAVRSLEDDGTLSQLSVEWFGIDLIQ